MKVAICVPHYGDVKAVFAQSLARLVSRSVANGLEIEVFFEKSSVLPYARNEVLGAGVQWGPDWLLLLDADHTFEPDTLIRMVRHGKPVVGCNYARRDGSGPVVEPRSGLEEVDHLGLGLFLIHYSAMERVAAKAASEGKDTAFPLFMLSLTQDGRGYVGEDVWFCRRLRDAGIPILCDHDLSREIGHVGETTFTIRGEVNARTIPPATGHQQGR